MNKGELVTTMSGHLSISPRHPGAIKQALNASGWLDDEVVAAGELRQGKAPSVLGMVSGTALIEVARPRRTKALPRRFVLAATADRIVAFKAWGGGGGTDDGPWRTRKSWQDDGQALDRVAVDVAAIVGRRGLA